MSFVGQLISTKLRTLQLGLLLLMTAAALQPVSAQTTAPYLLPYTMSTIAGPVASLTIGQACGKYFALDAVGDGCPAAFVSVSTDIHDIRVDAKGNIYWIDNGSKVIIHKISAVTGIETVYAGSLTQTTACATASDKQGDGCIASDGAANSTPKPGPFYTGSLAKSRGLGVAPNGDLYFADFGGNEVHKISASTGLYTLVAGSGTTSGGTAGYFDGPAATSQLSGPRGVGVDANGNVYIADTANNLLRLVTPAGVVSTLTAPSGAVSSGSGGCIKSVASGIPAITATLCAPEDAQVDANGNVFIAEGGNNVVRAIYMGKGTLPGIVAPQTGYIYLIAGYNLLNTSVTGVSYPKDGTTPTIPATTVSMSIRKIALDARGNLYIADSGTTSNNVWFVDALTGYVRLLAGSYGAPAGTTFNTPACATATNALGDGCPGPQSAMNTTAGADPGVSPDNQGNLLLSDSEGASSAATSRIRKLLSGLNFPSVNAGASVTQTLQVYFGPGDSPAATTPFTSSNPDFVIGTPACSAPNTDLTMTCTVPVKFTPSKAGYETSTITLSATIGGKSTYISTGTGNAAAIAIDPGTTAALSVTSSNAQGVALDGAGNAYVADTANNRVLFYNAATSTTTTFAGTGTAGYTGDGAAATAATLKAPRAVTVDTAGNVFVADTGNNVIRKITVATGVITTYAGGASTVCAAASDALGDNCLATQAKFSAPSGLAADVSGQIYVSDSGNNVIRQINVLGFVSALAGGVTTVCTANTDTFGDGCSALQAAFKAPAGLAYDATGNALIVADTGNSIVRKISLGNTITTAGTGTAILASGVLVNPVTLIAGNGQPSSSVDVNSVATLSSLNVPTGVAVDAAENIYIADTANSSIRMVSSSTGLISTIMGILGTSGTGTLGSAADTQLNAPSAIAITPAGMLVVTDAGNNRVLSDSRSQVTRNFGRVNIGSSSFVQTFTETSIGTISAALPTPLYVATGSTTLFSLTAPSGSTGCVANETLPIGISCVLNGQFTPATTGPFTATYTHTGATSVGAAPSITLVATGAVLTPTQSTAKQISPTGTAQFQQPLTLGASVVFAPTSTCNVAAPSCIPTGTVRLVIDGTAGAPLTVDSTGNVSQSTPGLSVGTHTLGCSYSGDNFYAASSCPTITITIAQAATVSLLSATNNNQPQFTPVLLTAGVVASTSGIPTGTVTFFANGVSLGTSSLDPTGAAILLLSRTLDTNGAVKVGTVDSTLAPGTYTLTCKYNGSSNYATSNCPSVTFTVTPDAPGFTLTARGCAAVNLIQTGTSNPGEGVAPSGSSGTGGCLTATEVISSTGVPTIATAQGSTTDATLFVNISNTLSGTLTFACTGLPAASTCTFAPTSIAVTPTSGTALPVYTDVTMWTDLQPGYATSSVGGVTRSGKIGWTLTLLGLLGVVGISRKRFRSRGLSLLASVLVLVGSSMAFTGCAGPGLYVPVLTPAGTYPVTVTVTGGGISKSTVINFKVSSPGLPGQQ